MKRPIVLTIVLTLNCAAWAWQPAPDSMLTEWGAKVTPETAWQEYPRPALARSSWSNLNGLWKYQVTSKSATAAPTDWAGDILVPFAIESALSGVKQRLTPEDALWYRRSFELPTQRDGQRTLLNFEAVDYQATVWVNDTQVGIHTGGNLPFSFDITSALKSDANTPFIAHWPARIQPGRDLSGDGTELHHLSSQMPKRVNEMSAQWEAWAKRVGVFPKPDPGGGARQRAESQQPAVPAGP